MVILLIGKRKKVCWNALFPCDLGIVGGTKERVSSMYFSSCRHHFR
jgi:hypothetical protein